MVDSKRPIKDLPLEAHRRYPIPEASRILMQSRAKTYVDIRSGKIKVIRDGGRTYVPGTELIRLSAIPASAFRRSALPRDLTKRELFAALLMPHMLQSQTFQGSAKDAVAAADALIAELTGVS